MADIIKIVISAVDQASGALGGVGKALGSLGSVAIGAAAIGIGAVVTEIGLATRAAMEAEEVQAQLGAVLKSTGGAAGVTAQMANDLASALQNTTRFEDDAILSGENMLLTFTNIGKNVFPDATQTMLDMSQALGQDLKSSAMQLGKALNNPEEGLTALQRVGVKFTDQQKYMITALTRSGKVEEAQAMILKELQTEFGGAAEAAGNTFAGKLDRMKNKLGDIQERIGGAFLPILSNVADVVLAKVVPAIETFVSDTLPKIEAFMGKIGGVVNALVGAGPASEEFKAAMQELIPADVLAGAQGAFAGVMKFLSPLTGAFSNLFAAIQLHMPEMQAALQGGMTFVQNIIATVGPYVMSALSGIVAGLSGIINTIASLWSQHGATIITILQTAWNVIVAVVGAALALVMGAIQAAIAVIGGILSAFEMALQGNWAGAWEAVKAGVVNALLAIWTAIQGAFASLLQVVGLSLGEFNLLWQTKLAEIINIVTTALQNAINAAKLKILGFVQVGKDIINGLVSAILGGIGSLTNAIGQAIQAAINAALSLTQEHSPSKVFADIGKNMILGLSQGIDSLSSLPALSVAVVTQGAIDTGYAAPTRQVASPIGTGGGLKMGGRSGMALYSPVFQIVTPDADSLIAQIEAIALGGGE